MSATSTVFDPASLGILQIATTHGVVEVHGYRHGQWAVTKRINADGWTITHLPSGMSVESGGGIFSDPSAAFSAIIEIASMKKDWREIKDHEKRALGSALRTILTRHGGTRSILPSRVAEHSREAYRTDLNGGGIA